MPLSDTLRELCPYPEDIYRQRTEVEWAVFLSALQAAGIEADGYLGSLSRYVWLLACEKLEEMEREQP